MEYPSKKVIGILIFVIILILVFLLIKLGIIPGIKQIINLGEEWLKKLFPIFT